MKDIEELSFETGILFLLSPTDCVKDRLAAYYFWSDRQALEQAKLVSESQPVDLDEIRRWSEVEDQLDKFEEIKRDLVIFSK